LSSVPVWVCFPSLHLKFWSQAILSKIASLVGLPLFMDKATTSVEKLAYAICFIEISANKPLQSSVVLGIEGGEKAVIVVEYEWLPPRCSKCNSFGYNDFQCPTKESWIPKDKSKCPNSCQSGMQEEVHHASNVDKERGEINFDRLNRSNRSPTQPVTRPGMYASAVQFQGTSSRLIPELVLNVNAREHVQESVPVEEDINFPHQAIQLSYNNEIRSVSDAKEN